LDLVSVEVASHCSGATTDIKIRDEPRSTHFGNGSVK
jgi:hypothetical protein